MLGIIICILIAGFGIYLLERAPSYPNNWLKRASEIAVIAITLFLIFYFLRTGHSIFVHR